MKHISRSEVGRVTLSWRTAWWIPAAEEIWRTVCGTMDTIGHEDPIDEAFREPWNTFGGGAE